MDLTTGIKPVWRLLANSQDVTDTIADRFVSLTLTDEVGVDSDMLEIRLADTDPSTPIRKPPRGAELELSIGYDDKLIKMGLFVADEFEIGGWPGELIIRARAAIYGDSKEGKTNLQTQKNRDWPKGTKLGDMAKKIAKDHGMTAEVAASLKNIALPHIDQADESDINMLVRLVKKYDAVVKPSNGKLILYKRGESKSVGGEELPTITLETADVARWRMVESSRETAGMVVAYYHAVQSAKRNEVKVGSGEPVRRLKRYYPSEEMALAAARSDLAKRKRSETTVSLSVVGAPEIAAECPLVLGPSFHPDVAGEWLIKRVTHSIEAESGYSCQVEGEKPNSEDEPEINVIRHDPVVEPEDDPSWANDL